MKNSLPQISVSQLEELNLILSAHKPRDIESVYLNDMPTIDIHGRHHSPYDGWTDDDGREYRAGEYIASEGGNQFASWAFIEVNVGGSVKSLEINKSAKSDFFKALYKFRQISLSATSVFIGEQKERLTLDGLTIISIYESEGFYGWEFTHLMTDACGNVYNWKTSKKIGRRGQSVSLVGTVKSHYESKNKVKTTVLTRCRLTEEKNAA